MARLAARLGWAASLAARAADGPDDHSGEPDLVYSDFIKDRTSPEKTTPPDEPSPRQSGDGGVESDLSASQLRELIDGAGVVIWDMDPATGRLRYINRRIESLLGIPADRLVADASLWADHLHPSDRADAIARRNRFIAEATGGELEYRAVAADGRSVWLREKISITPGPDGVPAAIRGVIWDIASRKRIERRFYAERRDLQARLDDLTYLHRLGERLAGLSDAEAIATETLASVASIVGAEMGEIRLVGAEGGRAATSATIHPGSSDGQHLGPRPDVCAMSIARGEAVALDDVNSDPPDGPALEAAPPAEIRAAYAVPLIGRRGVILGAVATYIPTPHRPSPRQEALIARYARLAADAIEMAGSSERAGSLLRLEDDPIAPVAQDLRAQLAAIQELCQGPRPGAHAASTNGEFRETLLRHVRSMTRLLDATRTDPDPSLLDGDGQEHFRFSAGHE